MTVLLHLVGAVRSMKEFLSSSCCSSVTFSRMWCRWSHGVIIKLSGLIYCQSIGDTGKYIYKMFSNGKIKHFKGIVHTNLNSDTFRNESQCCFVTSALQKKKNCLLQKTITPNDDRIIDYYYYYPFKWTVQCFFNEIDLVVKMCFLK